MNKPISKKMMKKMKEFEKKKKVYNMKVQEYKD